MDHVLAVCGSPEDTGGPLRMSPFPLIGDTSIPCPPLPSVKHMLLMGLEVLLPGFCTPSFVLRTFSARSTNSRRLPNCSQSIGIWIDLGLCSNERALLGLYIWDASYILRL